MNSFLIKLDEPVIFMSCERESFMHYLTSNQYSYVFGQIISIYVLFMFSVSDPNLIEIYYCRICDDLLSIPFNPYYLLTSIKRL
jgi:hypothetical protein